MRGVTSIFAEPGLFDLKLMVVGISAKNVEELDYEYVRKNGPGYLAYGSFRCW